MTNPETQNNGDVPANQPNGAQPQSWPLMVLMYAIVGPCVLFWESTKGLVRRTYTDAGSHDLSVLNVVIGVVVSLAAGIGVGYNMGWVGEATSPWYIWLSAGVGTAVGVFLYGWTLLHFIFFRHAIRISEKLYSHVDLDGDHRYRRETTKNPTWFTNVLLAVAWVATVALVGYIGYEAATYVQAHQDGYSWLGTILGIVVLLVIAVAAIAILGFIGSEISGGFCLLLILVIAALSWWKWDLVSGIFGGIYGNFTGSDWGNWGYVVGAVAAIVPAGISAAISFTLLRELGLRVVAVAISAAATYALLPLTAQYVGTPDLGAFSFAAPALPWLASALEFFLIVGYVFPLAHIVISHVFKRLANIFDLMESVYDEPQSGYREFFLSVATIIVTGGVAWYGPALVTAYLGYEAAWQVYGIVAGAALLTYTLGGKLLLRSSATPFGVAASGYAALTVYSAYIAHGYMFGTAGALAAAALAAICTFSVAFPAAYALVRWATQGWLVPFLREPLLKLHARLSSGIVELVEEFLSAARHTYTDTTSFKGTFAQIANITATAGLTYAAWIGANYFGFAFWLAALASVAVVITSYTLVGQLFKKQGNGLIGFLVSIVGGLFAGVMVHGAQPYGYWLSVPGGLVGAALTAGAVFPWAYLLVRKVLNIIAQEHWLNPLLVNVHEAVWNRFSNLRRDFLVAYRQVRDGINRMKDNFYRSYEQIRSQMFGGKK
jgi:hypothetical protein